MAGLRCLGSKTLDESHLPLHLALLPGRSRLLDLQGALSCNEVIVVVAPHQDYLVLFNGQHLGCDLVEKGAVVRCDDHPAPKGGQVLLEPQVCIKVKVVGRLIQEQEVGVLEQQPGQPCPHDPAAAELAHGPEKVSFLEPKAREDGFGLVVPVAPACGLERHLKPAKALHQLGLLRRVRFR